MHGTKIVSQDSQLGFNLGRVDNMNELQFYRRKIHNNTLDKIIIKHLVENNQGNLFINSSFISILSLQGKKTHPLHSSDTKKVPLHYSLTLSD